MNRSPTGVFFYTLMGVIFLMEGIMDEIVVIDYGSQYTMLLSRRIREFGVLCRVVSPERFDLSDGTKGIILSGGPQSVYAPGAYGLPAGILEKGLPILGICYGMQLIVKQLHGKVEKGDVGEYGLTEVDLNENELFEGIPSRIKTWMSHGDEVKEVPEGFKVLAKSTSGIKAAMTNGRIYGLQFHPEVLHTEFGTKIIEKFIIDVCKTKKEWKMSDYAREEIKKIRETVGEAKVVGALSGGVDSTVAAVLTSRAIGKSMVGIFVNHGLMRKNEEIEVADFLKKNDIEVRVVDASDLFFTRLKGVTDPETKRKIIGESFIEVFDREARNIDAKFLLQGTIYSDVIESAASSTTSDKIKSHHNVGGLPEKMNLKLIEPLRRLFKDEVRKLGRTIGIPDALIDRQPFPGPGLAVRIIGEINPERARILKEVDHNFLSNLSK